MSKVFVLSLHRNGTASTAILLEALGYSTVHCPRRIRGFQDGDMVDYEPGVAGIETSLYAVTCHLVPVLDSYEAASDVPLPVLGKQLLLTYPGSKFILLSRPVYDWIASVRAHCRHDFMPFERVQYWNLTEQHMPHISCYSNRQLADMYVKHMQMCLNDIPLKDLFIGDLYSPYIPQNIARFLGKDPKEAPPFPWANRRSR